jgi:hypothetical protein
MKPIMIRHFQSAHRACAAIVALILLGGCQSATAPAVNSPAVTTADAAQPLAVLERTGGFAPVEVLLTLENDGRYGLQIHRGAEALATTGTLDTARLADARAAIDAAGRLKEEYYNAAAADDRRYQLRHLGRTMRWSEAYNDLPAPLRRLGQLVDAMASEALAQRPPGQ